MHFVDIQLELIQHTHTWKVNLVSAMSEDGCVSFLRKHSWRFIIIQTQQTFQTSELFRINHF